MEKMDLDFVETDRASSVDYANSEAAVEETIDFKNVDITATQTLEDDKLVRTHYTFAFKLLVIEQAKENGNVYAAELFNLDRRVIAQWRRQEEHIRLSLAQTNASRARLVGGGRKPQSAELEARLFDWLMKFSDAKRQALSGRVIKQEARRISEELGLQEFVASSGWLRGFQERAKRKMTSQAGEKLNSSGGAGNDSLRDDAAGDKSDLSEHSIARGRSGRVEWKIERMRESGVGTSGVDSESANWKSILRILAPDTIAELRVAPGGRRRSAKADVKKEIVNRCYDVTFKLKVVERAIECGDTVQAAREFNVDRHCVAAWRKKEAALRAAVEHILANQAAGVLPDTSQLSASVDADLKQSFDADRYAYVRMRKRLAGGGRKQIHPQMDARVVEALKLEADRHGDTGEPRIIKPIEAMELAIHIARDLGVSERFTASAGWLSRFCDRNRQKLIDANLVIRRKKDE